VEAPYLSPPPPSKTAATPVEAKTEEPKYLPKKTKARTASTTAKTLQATTKMQTLQAT
jgi:hypothetical protein